MNLNDIINNINEYNICLLWNNIRKSSCKMCQEIVYKVNSGEFLFNSILKTYANNYFICKYLLFISNIQPNLSILKFINTYINIYNTILFKIKKLLVYPILILLFMFIFCIFIYLILNIKINIYLIFIMIIIQSLYIYYIFNNIYKKVQYILLLHVFSLFLKNIYNIHSLVKIYLNIYNVKLNVTNTNSLESISKLILNTHISSYDHCLYIINEKIQQLQYDCDLLPTKLFNSIIIFISVIIFNILYYSYIYIMNYL